MRFVMQNLFNTSSGQGCARSVNLVDVRGREMNQDGYRNRTPMTE